ncbi:hypothetical protein PRZ48_005200 [Zasmidium cellare]|uniref:CYTH domain-containing protein n=1 Tax=Zasmidium cellare TaxID=395010 RepID=A0ABR0ESD3_ZASCE|nr:hypothetical protein PRZ48_005200 [Zasmidium cellare]
MLTKSTLQYAVRASRPPPPLRLTPTKRFSTRTPNKPVPSHLEVERKFNVTPHLMTTLQKHEQKQKNPSLHPSPEPHDIDLHFSRKPDAIINDAYFDCLDLLSTKGVWVRQRTNLPLLDTQLAIEDTAAGPSSTSTTEWQAKVLIGGDYTNSQFQEIVGEEEVKKIVDCYLSWNDLAQTVALSTWRRSWTAQEHDDREAGKSMSEVLVVVDKVTSILSSRDAAGKPVTWEYTIGELEMTAGFELLGTDEGEATKELLTARMSAQLEEWMKRHGQLFPAYPTPAGKLTAFYAWMKEAGMRG